VGDGQAILTEYRQFMPPFFSPVQYSGDILAKSRDSPEYLHSSLSSMTKTLDKLNAELRTQVASQHTELFKQVNTVKQLEEVLFTVNSGVNELQENIKSIRLELMEPYLMIKERTEKLERVQTTVDLLRKVSRFLYVVKQLRDYLDSNKLPEAAESLHELDMIRSQSDLTGIKLIDKEIEWIVHAQENVLQSAERMLLQGMESQNQSHVANGLQVFYNFRILEEKLRASVTSLNAKVFQSIDTLLNDEFSEGGIRSRTDLWNRIERLMEEFYSCCVQCWHLQIVLAKMKDPITHQSFVADPNDVAFNLFSTFWTQLTTILRKQLISISNKSAFVSKTFVGEFPKLLKIFNDFLAQLESHVERKSILQYNFGMEKVISQFLSCLTTFEKTYLENVLSRLQAPIKNCFPNNSTLSASPTLEDSLNLARAIEVELELSKSDNELNSKVTCEAAKAIKQFTVSCESILHSDAEAYQVTEKMNGLQKANVDIFNALYQLHDAANLILPTLNPDSVTFFEASISHIDIVGQKIINPIFTRITALLENTIFLIHKEGYGTGKHNNLQTASGFIITLQKQVKHFRAHIISNFVRTPALYEKVKLLTTRVLHFFIQQASLLRPLSPNGAFKFAADTAELEVALTPLYPVKNLPEYKYLRAMRQLFFRETEMVIGSGEIKVLPPTVLMHHMFSRGPVELLSPHVYRGWGVLKYSKWLDTHEEEDVWRVIKATLDSYAQKINARGDTEFHPCYPVMLQLMEQLQ